MGGRRRCLVPLGKFRNSSWSSAFGVEGSLVLYKIALLLRRFPWCSFRFFRFVYASVSPDLVIPPFLCLSALLNSRCPIVLGSGFSCRPGVVASRSPGEYRFRVSVVSWTGFQHLVPRFFVSWIPRILTRRLWGAVGPCLLKIRV